MARKKTVRVFEEWRAEPANLDVFFARLEGSDGREAVRFRDACFELKVPYTLMYAFVHGDEAMKARYEAVLAAKADALEHEALEIADKVKPKRDEVARAKLQVETRHRLASKWNDERYGDRVKIEKSVTVSVGEDLLGVASDLLAKVRGRTVEGVVLGQVVAPASFSPDAVGALPARAVVAGETVTLMKADAHLPKHWAGDDKQERS